MAAGQLGRPSGIFATIREARCDACGAWIRAGILQAHRETEHPMKAPQGGGDLRDVPVPMRIAEYVEAGNYLVDAAAACGIPRRTVTRWMGIGEAIDEEFGAEAEAAEIPVQRRIFWLFWRAVTMGRQASRTQQLRFIAKDRDWRARAWILERTAPEQFSRMEKLRVGQDPDAGPLRVVHEEADPDFISEVMRIYTEQGVVPGVDSGNGKRPARKRARKEA